MKFRQKTVELLSPAKNLEYGKTALNFGADAVYIGAPSFGARASAGNSIADIELLCSYAHRYNAKVYVAMNTILYENELNEAEKLIHQLYNAGADALIIQDMGITEMNLPPIALHVSTQAHSIEPDKIKFFENVGFTRVVPARELSLAEISKIKQLTDIELEVFVHGAICVSYSGQCYMSAHIGTRSGNRGECAQTCRMKYDLIGTDNSLIQKDKQVLSLKDMNRSDYLADLIDAGVHSFKIEGRMKDITYLKNVTAFYRKNLDKILENSTIQSSSLGKFRFDFEPDPERTFSRGYTDYFLSERKPEMTAGTSKSVGKLLGEVKKSAQNFIEIDTTEQISNGDGLCFFDSNGEISGFSVNKSEGCKVFIPYTLDVNIGTKIYRNLDHEFNKKLNASQSCRVLPVNLKFSETFDGFELSAGIENTDYFVRKSWVTTKEPAKNVEKARENLITQLSKSGDTEFEISNLELNLSAEYFIPLSELNRFRRETLAELSKKLGENYLRYEKKFEPNDVKFPVSELTYTANIANSFAQKFYARHGVTAMTQAFELNEPKARNILMTTKFCIKYNLGQCPKVHTKTDSPKPKYLKLNGETFYLEFDCENCRMEIVSQI